MNKFIKIPDKFYLGGAIAAEEVEGLGITPKARTEWDLFFAESPQSFFHGINNSYTNNMMVQYQEDLNLFQAVGANSIRISISWSRIFPEKNKLSQTGIDYYHAFLDYAAALNIDVIVTLMHFDLPAYFFNHKNDGWNNPETIAGFVQFADVVFQEYGSKVKYFATFNEPIVALEGYTGSKKRYPLLDNLKLGYQCMANIVLAHARVVNLFKTKYQHINAQIGIVLNWAHCYPKDNQNFTPADFAAANKYNHLHNYFFLSPAILGKFEAETRSFLQEMNCDFHLTPTEIDEIAANPIDWLGVNFYAPTRVEISEQNDKWPFKLWKWDQGRFNHFRGWEIHPETLLEISAIIQTKYHNLPWMICENGMGVENEGIWRNLKTQQIEDDYRISFIAEHLDYLFQAVAKGGNCFGYHLWAMIDNWSWINAYKNRYGLIELDLNNYARRIKKSGNWFKQLTDSKQLDLDYRKVDEIIDYQKIKYSQSN
ncbi:6-phospho-beta-glucosidase [Mycoplasmoides fastidiosum]|uniref:6-phospho-beta-glucosidase n=1 Tax=Mycoplasmoides fastidiosum TaxID=92758 RepID=A0ABU0LYT8_9BACT|nr:glycoside hydrolase family 1 protein [Mycoplasmoides fastidiosum]MDQ0513860.1 6-phospho-beta-glucosidase [Mycoplasmoides fastidiosum]UUD37726.1 glycoside hydrolase family 1 protein [Mycoplasmoides fastidiosum]